MCPASSLHRESTTLNVTLIVKILGGTGDNFVEIPGLPHLY